MEQKHVQTRREGRVVVATLDNPPHQLMTFAIVAELDRLVAEVERAATGELPVYDPAARTALLDGSYVELTEPGNI